MSDRAEFVHEIVGELRDFKALAINEPPADIDMVWGLSAPGTVKEIANDGVYSGISFDLQVVRHCIKVVRHVTAARTGKAAEDITKEDILEDGPVFFYNGEDANTNRGKYLQNEHLEELAQDPDFQIPKPKLVVDRIDEIATPSQVIGLAEFLRTTSMPIGKIAVVSLAPHSIRVGRYLEHHRHLFPEDVTFINTPAPQPHHSVGTTFREAHKVLQYADMGHLARETIFKNQEPVKIL